MAYKWQLPKFGFGSALFLNYILKHWCLH